MRAIFITGVSVVLFSCGSPGKKEKDKSPASEPVSIAAEKLPASVSVDGKLVEAWQWTDKTGENILVLSMMGPVNENDYSSAQLHGVRWVKEEKDFGETWDLFDSVDSCEFDVTLGFIKGATTITDLDNDGIKEVTFLYRKACRSDVSPAAMNLIMHEGNDLFYLKGLSWIKESPDDHFTVTEKDANLETLADYHETEEEYLKTFGRYASEKSFASAPPEFLLFARQQWIKFVKESFE